MQNIWIFISVSIEQHFLIFQGILFTHQVLCTVLNLFIFSPKKHLMQMLHQRDLSGKAVVFMNLLSPLISKVWMLQLRSTFQSVVQRTFHISISGLTHFSLVGTCWLSFGWIWLASSWLIHHPGFIQLIYLNMYWKTWEIQEAVEILKKIPYKTSNWQSQNQRPKIMLIWLKCALFIKHVLPWWFDLRWWRIDSCSKKRP